MEASHPRVIHKDQKCYATKLRGRITMSLHAKVRWTRRHGLRCGWK
jgi:hypothetical protein